ncbi:hypothetical protein MPC4_30090 [Methylocella tundrae]|uniref:Uncharacterized protein n=1 Tax=Methylocella tundrae TaxID=227605 RepID=A0A8B6M7T7_METTU|nr:hypothetical protein MPC1_3470003 [Methylocella tundrae]VTZ50906.1 hypothetical protein MPC4_30090 [Methylocella tundrae]
MPLTIARLSGDPINQGYVGRPRQNAASLQQAFAGADSAPLIGSPGRFSPIHFYGDGQYNITKSSALEISHSRSV